jgi:uncharacterized damage-inducible protein DinB
MAESLPEVWLRGPLEGVPALLQPVAHALLQATEEIKEAMKDFPHHLLWERPAGLASPGFHLLHITGVLHRLCTYARGEALTGEQLLYLSEETKPQPVAAAHLVAQVEQQVQQTIQQLKATAAADLAGPRPVGRKALPSTVGGLLFHAAEHTMRHLGQLLVTATVLKERSPLI